MTIRRPSLTLALLLTCAAGPVLAQTAGADPYFAATTLNLTASGEAKVAPDMATIGLGVDVTAASAGQAMSANAARMAKVIAALKAAGVEPRDLQTSNLSLTPQTVYQDGHPPRITGYQASNQLSVTVRDLSKLGPIADAVVGAGADTMGQISFGLADPQAADDAARLAAVKSLQDKAALYARATGYKVVRLVQLGEGVAEAPAPRAPGPLMAMRANAAPTPIETGQLEVQISVSGLFELGR